MKKLKNYKIHYLVYKKKMHQNILLLTDSYKVSHHVQYPPKTEKIVSYFESRGGKYDEICFFGLQYLIKRYLTGVVVTAEKIREAKEFYQQHFGSNSNIFNEKGWKYILETHGGKLPIIIKALPEGTIVPTRNACMTVENTDPNCFWLVNFLETLLVQVWYPTTVATNSREQKKILLHSLHLSGDISEIDFKLHDFGCRGVSSMETAGIGAAAHLTQFLGTDTIPGLVVAREYYGAECAGFSIPASEHSTITSWGYNTSGEESSGGEIAAMKNMLDQYPEGLVACVSDSYDIWDAATNKFGKELKSQILERKGTLVIRPDSGPPPLMDERLLTKLEQSFGTSTNSKNFKELPPQIRIIQGDGIDIKNLSIICGLLIDQKWSINNIAFGSGGGLLQKLNRDTLKCAFKCSYAIVDGKERKVFKDPIHKTSGKKSKAGKLTVNKRNGIIKTLIGENRDESDNLLVKVFENGRLITNYSWEDVKINAEVSMRNYSTWGPKIKQEITNNFETYLQSYQYLKDVEDMKLAEENYQDLYNSQMNFSKINLVK